MILRRPYGTEQMTVEERFWIALMNTVSMFEAGIGAITGWLEERVFQATKKADE